MATMVMPTAGLITLPKAAWDHNRLDSEGPETGHPMVQTENALLGQAS